MMRGCVVVLAGSSGTVDDRRLVLVLYLLYTVVQLTTANHVVIAGMAAFMLRIITEEDEFASCSLFWLLVTAYSCLVLVAGRSS